MNASNTAKRISVFLGGRLNIIRACRSAVKTESSKISVLCDQILDSTIVDGIAGISAYIYAGEVSLKAGVLSFLLTFLIKMKE